MTKLYYLLLSPTNDLVKTGSHKYQDELVRYHAYKLICAAIMYKGYLFIENGKGEPVENAKDVLKNERKRNKI